ncbi:MAG: SIS domain-containing protein [Pararhizobium sp.]
MTDSRMKPAGLVAIEGEMARQVDDTLRSFKDAAGVAADVARSIRSTGRLLMLGMGASHAVGRAVEPLYRAEGIDAIAVPVSEQLAAPLGTEGRTVLLTSQSGESAEILRWLRENETGRDMFGLTLDAASTLGRAVPSLVGAGGAEKAFAATRSITVSLGLHLAVLAALGVDPDPTLAALKAPAAEAAQEVQADLAKVRSIVVSGRRLQGLAEAIALGIMELARIPALALEGGQLRHGPPEMFSPEVGLIFFRSDEPGAGLTGATVELAKGAGAPVVVFDSSGAEPIDGAITVALPKASGMTAILAALPLAQRFMLAFAAARVADVGTPCRSTKITRSE